MKNIFILAAAFVLLAAGCGAKPLNTGNTGQEIIAFGDSLTAGNGAWPGEDYPSVLGQMVNMPVINLGGPGDTARAGANRKEEIGRHSPHMVLIEFGGNDAIRGRPYAETKAAIEEIVEYAQSFGAIAVVVDTGGNFKMSPYTKMLKQIAEEKRALFVPEIMDGIFYKPELKSDGIHPNAAGYKLIAEKVYKKIKLYLKQ